MKHRLIAYFVFAACGLCLLIGLGEKGQASNNANGLLGAVGQVRGEHRIIFIMEEEEKLHVQGNQKWQLELTRQLENVTLTIKDALNMSVSDGHFDNTLTLAASCKITDRLDGKYTGTKVFRLTDNENTCYKGFEHRLDTWYKWPDLDMGVTLRNLSRTYDNFSSSDYQTKIYQTSLTRHFGMWVHKITLKVETQQYPQNAFRDYTLSDISYNGKISLTQSTVNLILQHENKKFTKNRYDGYEKKLIGASFLGNLIRKNDLKLAVQYLDRVVPGRIDKRYIKTNIGSSGSFVLLGGVVAQLELDNIVVNYPHLLPEQDGGDYIQRKGKLSFSELALFSTKVAAYFGLDMKDFISESRSNVHKWNTGLSMEYRKNTNAKTVASFERQGMISQKTADSSFQIKHTQQVDKGLEYELTYTKNSKESSVGLCIEHSM